MKKIEDLWREAGITQPLPLDRCPVHLKGKNRVHLLALGDVGASVLTGLRLLGGDVISEIGIFDMRREAMDRLEMELNQVNYPFGEQLLPKVCCIEAEQLFDCDVFIFCASKGVPPLSEKGDVRMAQLAANRELVSLYGRQAKEAGYQGLAAIVSDPVDPLCKAFLESSELEPCQVQGYGLGVMHSRAMYFAEKNQRFADYLEKGRAFGPHGEDLVLANSLDDYDDGISKELTGQVTQANMRVRELGFKPYIAPAYASGAISILLTLRGDWHYSSLYLGDGKDGAFFGMKNKMTEEGPVYEEVALSQSLFERLQHAYDKLRKL